MARSGGNWRWKGGGNGNCCVRGSKAAACVMGATELKPETYEYMIGGVFEEVGDGGMVSCNDCNKRKVLFGGGA